MTDPVTTAIATALVTKAVSGLSDAGKAAFAALARLVRHKLADNETSRAVLERAESQPGDDGRRALATALEQAATKDQAFAVELRMLWLAVQGGEAGVGPPRVFNVVSGEVSGTVIQANDIHGGISLGGS